MWRPSLLKPQAGPILDASSTALSWQHLHTPISFCERQAIPCQQVKLVWQVGALWALLDSASICAVAGSLGSHPPSPSFEADCAPATTSGRPSKRGRGAGAGEKRKSKKDDLRSKNREAQRRFREKQKYVSAPCPAIAGYARMLPGLSHLQTISKVASCKQADQLQTHCSGGGHCHLGCNYS